MSAFVLQAVDFLAIKSEVDNVCCALAAKLFAAEPSVQDKSTRCVPTEVLLRTLAFRLGCWLVNALDGQTFLDFWCLHPL
jgi:hypothetical protein